MGCLCIKNKMKKYNLSIVIPAYNESLRINETLLDLNNYLNAQNYSWEIIVVSDGSTDNTNEIVENLKRKIKNLNLVSYARNKGKGFATKTGIKKAQGQWVLFMDADNSTNIREIKKFWKKTDKFGVLYGSRSLPDKETKRIQPIQRKIISRLSNWLIRKQLKINITDTQCGFKLFKNKQANKIFDKITIDRFGFDIEITAICMINNIKIGEIAVNWENSTGSKVRAIRDIKRSFLDLNIIKDNMKKGIYK